MKQYSIMLASILFLGVSHAMGQEVSVWQVEFSEKDKAAATRFWHNFLRPVSEETIAAMSGCVGNPRVLEARCPLALDENQRGEVYSPLEAVSCWAAMNREDENWMKFFRGLVQADIDNKRRIASLEWGVHHLSVDVISVFLKAGTDVTKAPKILVTLVERCKWLIQTIEKSNKEKESIYMPLKRDFDCAKQMDSSRAGEIMGKAIMGKVNGFAVEWNSQLEVLDEQRDAVFHIEDLLLKAKADISGVAAMDGGLRADLAKYSLCKSIFDQVNSVAK